MQESVCQACGARSQWRGSHPGGRRSLISSSASEKLAPAPVQSEPATSSSHHGVPEKEQSFSLGAALAKMDPLSITVSYIALASCLAKVTGSVIEITRDARHAGEELDAISAGLQSLDAILTPFAIRLPTLAAAPKELIQPVNAILLRCVTVLEQIDRAVKKYRKNRVPGFAKIGWIVSGQSDMRKLRDSLEESKTGLNLGIHLISISVSEGVKEDTTAIRADMGELLAKMESFQSGHRKKAEVERWMEDIGVLTAYAETAYAETAYQASVTGPADDDPSPPASEPTTGDTSAAIFKAVYTEGDPGDGIGGYDLGSPSDRVFALDYKSSGKLDHLVLFRPGKGRIAILQNRSGVFTPVLESASGIATFDIRAPHDRAIAFDYNSTGHLDHIAFYRPGSGVIYIVRTSAGNKFTTVFQSHAGLGGYGLHSPSDRIFAFDYNHSGKQDHLAIYCPGTGIILIFRNDAGTFSPVYTSHTGIGTFDLLHTNDRAFAFDWDSSGKMDHIALYRPGEGVFTVVKNDHGKFTSVWTSPKSIIPQSPPQGIGDYDLADERDMAFAYDWAHTGRLDHVALYRPGTETFWVVARDHSDAKRMNGWKTVFPEGEGSAGQGVGGYDLKRESDRIFAFDYDSMGKMDCLVANRRNGTGTIWIVKHV
ncbi:hypothetical protein B0T14DRAFT_88087 [Immersiella caudata]|uniref:Fungal N-terminal domain-containing protein n=1 Tax=Immersiella caudata TaxID=314043 RepID=A0AA40C5G0_9PEZI|nr:hypothetical protein B0T14DRAFT_88087 [Immersiella caudata]